LQKLSAQVPDWKVIDAHTSPDVCVSTSRRPGIRESRGAVAEAEGTIRTVAHLGTVDVKTYTHKIDGLTESDFILAPRSIGIPHC